jgi:GPH family glycoside/pentoside/hexuronide:cation symporter
VLYTYTGLAYNTLPTYVTNDPIDRSQMMIYAMLFAGATQTIMASTISPMLEFFGGMSLQSAWVKSCLVFGIIGLIFPLSGYLLS